MLYLELVDVSGPGALVEQLVEDAAHPLVEQHGGRGVAVHAPAEGVEPHARLQTNARHLPRPRLKEESEYHQLWVC